ncbi:MAG TPA: LuxR C-terminal-related transcriptional regulator [Hyphomicrobiaceae bacterium]|nr:LuxR C-terminal-related transcriptional regulator [Hyphomicrobiaceae bacterium]
MRDEKTDAIDGKRLVEEIYETVLRPDRYGRFMELWGAYVDGAVGQSARDGSGARENRIALDPLIAAHFERVFSLFEKMGRADRPGDPQAIVSGHHAIALLMTPTGDVVSQSRAASERWGTVSHAQELQRQVTPESWLRLSSARERLRYSFSPLSSGVIVLEPHDNDDARAGTSFLVMRPCRSPTGARLLMLYSPAIRWSPAIDRQLTEGFGLTVGEAAVVRDIADGLTPDEIARQRNRSVNTVRTQLKSVFAKTGTQGQPDLVRLAHLLASGDEAALADVQIDIAQIDEGVTETLSLPDGRRLDWHVIGPPDGRPVLFVHGMLDGVAVSKVVSRSLHRRNIRLVAPVRPAFGNSSPLDMPHAAATEAFGKDVAHLLKHCEIDAPVVALGHMAGAVYAFAAAAGPARIKSILAVSGGVPIQSLSQFAVMNARQRVVAYTARFAPMLLPAILRAGIAQIDSGSIDDFMDALYPPDSVDSLLLKQKNVRDAVQVGYRFAVAQGHRGFEIDSWHVTRDWSDLVRASNIRSLHVHGKHDPVVSIESVRAFTASVGPAELCEVADAGQLVFYADPDLVLDRLEELIGD